MDLVGRVLSCVGTRILAWPRQKLMLLCCHCCTMFAELYQGCPKRRGYARGASRASSIANILNMCPPTVIVNLRSSPNGLRDLESAMRSHNGHTSQLVMPRRLQVALLLIFSPEPPSTMHPGISCPCTRTFMAGLWWSTTTDPVVDSAKLAGIAT